MYLFVGLGNPGPKYSMNRHNVGFMLMDAIAKYYRADYKSEKEAHVAKVQIDTKDGQQDALLVKPQTYMNLSGQSVQALQAFYKVGLDRILVAHDEIDLPYGTLRIQKNRGHGGHNGIRDIHAKIGPDYARLRMGVGRPTIPQMNVADYVLQNFSDQEMHSMPGFLSRSAEALLVFADIGFEKAQGLVNQEPKDKKV